MMIPKTKDKTRLIVDIVVFAILVAMFVFVIVSIFALYYRPDSTLAYFAKNIVQMIQEKLGLGA